MLHPRSNMEMMLRFILWRVKDIWCIMSDIFPQFSVAWFIFLIVGILFRNDELSSRVTIHSCNSIMFSFLFFISMFAASLLAVSVNYATRRKPKVEF